MSPISSIDINRATLVDVPVKDLIPHELNANIGEEAFLEESMKANGFFGVVLVQRSTNKIIAGKHRWTVAKKNGLKKIPALVYDVDDESVVRWMLADNRIQRMGHDDEQKLAAALLRVKEHSGDVIGTGYDQKSLKEIVKQASRVPMETLIHADSSSGNGSQRDPFQEVPSSSERQIINSNQSPRYPLAIVLTVSEYRSWMNFKGSKSDTDAFKDMLKMVDVKTQPVLR